MWRFTFLSVLFVDGVQSIMPPADFECLHGGMPKDSIPECTEPGRNIGGRCKGAWKGSQHKDIAFYSSESLTSNPISSYTCKMGSGNMRNHQYRLASEGYPTSGECQLEKEAIFYTPDESDPASVPIYEHIDDTYAENHFYGVDTFYPGFKMVRIAFYAYPDPTSSFRAAENVCVAPCSFVQDVDGLDDACCKSYLSTPEACNSCVDSFIGEGGDEDSPSEPPATEAPPTEPPTVEEISPTEAPTHSSTEPTEPPTVEEISPTEAPTHSPTEPPPTPTPTELEVKLVPVWLALIESAETHKGRIMDYTLSLDAYEWKACTLYDRTEPLESLSRSIYEATEEAVVYMDEVWPDNVITNRNTPLGIAIGGGLDSSIGVATNWPLAYLTYKDQDPHPSQLFGLLRAPDQTEINVITNPQVSDDVKSFDGPSARVSYIKSRAGANEGVVGTYVQPWDDVLETIYNPGKGHEKTYSQIIVQGFYEVLRTKLTYQLSEVEFDEFFQGVLDGMPPTFETDNDKDLFFKLFEVFGTSLVSEATYGGVIELAVDIDSAALETFGGMYSKSDLERFVSIMFTDGTGEGGHSGDVPEDLYNIITSTWTCGGGDPQLGYQCGNGATTTKDWLATVAAAPQGLTYKVSPITSFIRDPVLREAALSASDAYLKKNDDWWDGVNKCPYCSGFGYTCEGGTGDTCLGCESPCRSGRRCNDYYDPFPCIYENPDDAKGNNYDHVTCPYGHVARGMCNSGKAKGNGDGQKGQNCLSYDGQYYTFQVSCVNLRGTGYRSVMGAEFIREQNSTTKTGQNRTAMKMMQDPRTPRERAMQEQRDARALLSKRRRRARALQDEQYDQDEEYEYPPTWMPTSEPTVNEKWVCGGSGDYLECPEGEVVIGRCASGGKKDVCGEICPNYYGNKDKDIANHAIKCALPPEPYTVLGEGTYAYWTDIYDQVGGLYRDCPAGMLMCGACSGKAGNTDFDCKEEYEEVTNNATNRAEGYSRLKCCGRVYAMGWQQSDKDETTPKPDECLYADADACIYAECNALGESEDTKPEYYGCVNECNRFCGYA